MQTCHRLRARRLHAAALTLLRLSTGREDPCRCSARTAPLLPCRCARGGHCKLFASCFGGCEVARLPVQLPCQHKQPHIPRAVRPACARVPPAQGHQEHLRGHPLGQEVQGSRPAAAGGCVIQNMTGILTMALHFHVTVTASQGCAEHTRCADVRLCGRQMSLPKVQCLSSHSHSFLLCSRELTVGNSHSSPVSCSSRVCSTLIF